MKKFDPYYPFDKKNVKRLFKLLCKTIKKVAKSTKRGKITYIRIGDKELTHPEIQKLTKRKL